MKPLRKYLRDFFAERRILGKESDLRGLVRADTLLGDLINEQRVPGLAISVLKEGETLFQKGYGYANIDKKTPVDPTRTVFRIASVSKPIAATALAHAVAEGLIALDASFYDYVPYYPRKRWDFTIRQLAGHTAGIRGYQGMEYGLDKPLTIKEGIDIFKEDDLLFEPGTDYLYNSYDWVLISLAMQEASGVPFEEYVRKKVLEPLGMKNTFAENYGDAGFPTYRQRFSDDPYLSAQDSSLVSPTYSFPSPNIHEVPLSGSAMEVPRGKNDGLDIEHPKLSKCYSKNRTGFRLAKSVNNAYKLAGGGYLSTSEDIAKLGQAYLDRNIREKALLDKSLGDETLHQETGLRRALPDEQTLASFITSQLINGKPTYYGLGWQVSQDADGRNYYGHVGNGVGGYSNFYVFPEQQMVFSILTNCTDPKVQGELDTIRETIFAAADGHSRSTTS